MVMGGYDERTRLQQETADNLKSMSIVSNKSFLHQTHTVHDVRGHKMVLLNVNRCIPSISNSISLALYSRTDSSANIVFEMIRQVVRVSQ